MKIIDKVIQVPSRSTTYTLYGLGDTHVGGLNCAEQELRRLVRIIEKDPHALWVGGGDYCDAVILNDAKRFDVNTLPDWMLTGKAGTVRKRIRDVLTAQRKRFLKFVDPIKDKCLGLLEGNHEYTILKYHNRDHLATMAEALETEELTDCCFLRLVFRRPKGKKGALGCAGKVVTVFACHGHGGGRTSGAEPNRLFRLGADKGCDIVLTGHSHTYFIHPPVAMLTIPHSGELPQDPLIREKYMANWGAFVYTYAAGPSTYASRANYPVRPMYTVQTIIQPHKHVSTSGPELPVIKQVPLKL